MGDGFAVAAPGGQPAPRLGGNACGHQPEGRASLRLAPQMAHRLRSAATRSSRRESLASPDCVGTRAMLKATTARANALTTWSTATDGTPVRSDGRNTCTIARAASDAASPTTRRGRPRSLACYARPHARAGIRQPIGEPAGFRKQLGPRVRAFGDRNRHPSPRLLSWCRTAPSGLSKLRASLRNGHRKSN